MEKKIRANNVICDSCGNGFYLKLSRIERAKNHFCSVRCATDFKKRVYLGQNNPNSKYVYDDKIFDCIDTEFKAWFLGWILSDGSIGKGGNVTIAIDSSEIVILEKIQKMFCKEIEIKKIKNRNLVSYTISSKYMVNRIKEIAGIPSDVFAISSNMFALNDIPDSLFYHFVRGYFEGDGYVADIVKSKKSISPNCKITSNSEYIVHAIADRMGIACSFYLDGASYILSYNGVNALDFLGKLYDGAEFFMTRKRDLYIDACMWEPTLKNSSKIIDNIKFAKTQKEAVIPSKKNVSDSGYDLTLIGVYKKKGEVVMFETGIMVSPPFGYYFDLIPRSSIIKSGYILANSIGVIDRTYVGSIKVPLIKVDKTKPDLELPIKIAQLVPRKICHFDAVEVESLEMTARGEGGFGSTDKK